MKGPPQILTTEAIQYGRVGSNVELMCDAFGIPPPKDILWVNFGYQVPIDGASDHYKIITQNRKDGVRSRLIIRPVTDSDFGDYNCTVLNSHGVDSYVISLKEERKYCEGSEARKLNNFDRNTLSTKDLPKFLEN